MAASLVVLLLAVVGGGGGYLAMQHARTLQDSVVGDLQQGAAELQAAKAAVVKANSAGGGPADLQTAIEDFQRARVSFQRAVSAVQADPVLGGAAMAPGVGASYVTPRTRTVAAIGGMGVALADAGEESTRLDGALLAPAAPGTTTGEKVLGVMTLVEQKTPVIRSALQRAQQQASNVDLQFVPAAQKQSLAIAKADIAKGLTQMDQFGGLAPALIDFLGGNGKRTYLVLQPDPAELRGGGGFIGSYSLLTASKGVISLGHAGNTIEIDYPRPVVPTDPKYVLAPVPLRQFTHGQSYIVGDSLFVPDFPQAAQTAEKLYQHEAGSAVDGVVSIDPWAVAALLSVTGPIQVPGWNTTVDAASFPEAVFQQQQKSANQVANRKLFFSTVASLMIERVTHLPAAQWSKLIAALNTSATQRHLQIYVNKQAAQDQIAAVGWSGAMVKSQVAAGETMLEVESNFGGDKANHWLARSYNLALTVSGGKLHHDLTVTYVNSTPPGYAGGQTYNCYVRFYYPTSGTGAAYHGPGTVKPTDELHPGFNLVDGWFNIKVNSYRGVGTARIGFVWDTPLSAGSSTSIYWQKQAGTIADPIRVTYTVGGKTYSASSNLAQDRVVVVSATGVTVQPGQAGQAQIPIFG